MCEVKQSIRRDDTLSRICAVEQLAATEVMPATTKQNVFMPRAKIEAILSSASIGYMYDSIVWVGKLGQVAEWKFVRLFGVLRSRFPLPLPTYSTAQSDIYCTLPYHSPSPIIGTEVMSKPLIKTRTSKEDMRRSAYSTILPMRENENFTLIDLPESWGPPWRAVTHRCAAPAGLSGSCTRSIHNLYSSASNRRPEVGTMYFLYSHALCHDAQLCLSFGDRPDHNHQQCPTTCRNSETTTISPMLMVWASTLNDPLVDDGKHIDYRFTY